jgi:hypothetical protein
MWIETTLTLQTATTCGTFIQPNSWMWIETCPIQVPYYLVTFIQLNSWMWIETTTVEGAGPMGKAFHPA